MAFRMDTRPCAAAPTVPSTAKSLLLEGTVAEFGWHWNHDKGTPGLVGPERIIYGTRNSLGWAAEF